MKLKLVVVDLELTRRQKRFGALGLAAAAALSATVAFAAPQAFTQGETLTAAKLNSNFADLQAQIDAIHAQAPERPAFEGFSVETEGFPKSSGWANVVLNRTVFNTFGAASYNATTGTFTAPKAGYYRFGTGGFIATASAVADSRVAYAIMQDGLAVAVSGGQLSAVDTPAPSFDHTLLLQAGDTISLRMYSTTPIQLGLGPNNEYQFWFQGEFLGP